MGVGPSSENKNGPAHRVSRGDTMLLGLQQPGAGNIVVSGCLRMRTEEILSTTTVNHALAILQRRHTRLRSWVDTEAWPDTLPYSPAPASADETPSIPLQTIVETTVDTPEAADEAMHESTNTLLHYVFEWNVQQVPVGVHLIRVKGTTEYRLVLGIAHILADLQASHQLFRELVHALGVVAFGTVDSIHDSTSSEDASNAVSAEPSLADYIPSDYNGWWNFVSQGGLGALNEMVGMGEYNRILAWDLAEDSSTCKMVRASLTPDETALVVGATKRNNTTIHGLLSAILVHAMRHHLNLRADRLEAAEAAARRGVIPFPLTTTLDVRRRIRDPEPPLPPELLGNLSTVLATSLKIPVIESEDNDGALWEHATASRDLQITSLEEKDYIKSVILSHLPSFIFVLTSMGTGAVFAEKLPMMAFNRLAKDVQTKPILAPVTLGNAGSNRHLIDV